MPRATISTTDAFWYAVAAYQAQRGIPSWSQAVLELAAIGLRSETGRMPPRPYVPWGGKREPRRPDVEEVKLPPLDED